MDIREAFLVGVRCRQRYWFCGCCCCGGELDCCCWTGLCWGVVLPGWEVALSSLRERTPLSWLLPRPARVPTMLVPVPGPAGCNTIARILRCADWNKEIENYTLAEDNRTASRTQSFKIIGAAEKGLGGGTPFSPIMLKSPKKLEKIKFQQRSWFWAKKYEFSTIKN